MKHLYGHFFSFLLLTGAYSQTYAMPPRPAICPNTVAIKAAGLSYTELDEDSYTVYQINNYGTRNTWAFGITSIQASSPLRIDPPSWTS